MLICRKRCIRIYALGELYQTKVDDCYSFQNRTHRTGNETRFIDIYRFLATVCKMEFKKNLPSDTLSAFCLEVSMLLKSGIPIADGMRIIIYEEKSSKGKTLLENIYDNLEMGLTFSQALKDTKSFPDYMISMVELGEKTGSLEKILNELYLYYKREDELKHTIKNALTYPIFMTVILIIVLIILTTKVLPIFENVFLQLGSEMPKTAITVMNIGTAFSNIAFYIVILFAILGIVAFIMSKTEKGIKTLYAIKNIITKNSKTSEAIGISRLLSALSLTIASGYDTFDALDLGMKLSGNLKVEERVKNCISLITKGNSLPQALELSGIIKSVHASILSIGFQSGYSESAMNEIAEKYKNTAENKINTLISSIEPAIVIVLSILIGIILLTVMLPLWGIMSSIV